VKPRIRVVAAVVIDSQDNVLIAERPAGKHMAGWWEFPGGKVAPGEADSAALARELREELGIDATPGHEIDTVTHEYDDRIVDLVFWQVARYSGAVRGLDGQRVKWVPRAALSQERILEADRPFVERLASC
jgi:8-oxo-dGTP diphosphatase